MKYQFVLAAVFSMVCVCIDLSAQSAVVTLDDLKILEGSEWVGQLTYRDYSSNKQTSIKSTVRVSRTKTDDLVWTFDMRYPLEPKANKASEIRLGTDGKTLADENVVERLKLADGSLRIVTTKPGKDNGLDTVFRFTYLIGPSAFTIRKEVKVNGTDSYFERNIYTWTR